MIEGFGNLLGLEAGESQITGWIGNDCDAWRI
jgi:hypothetical protein